MHIILGLLRILMLVGSAQLHSERFDASPQHTTDSYVLILEKVIIQRGPDFSQRRHALDYVKHHHLRSGIWFSTPTGCFINSDPQIMSILEETEKPQGELAREQSRIGGSNLESALQLSKQQVFLTHQRDTLIWNLFERLKNEKKLQAIGTSCALERSFN